MIFRACPLLPLLCVIRIGREISARYYSMRPGSLSARFAIIRAREVTKMSDTATLEFQNDEIVPRWEAVRVAEKMDIAAAIQVIRMGFATDPIARWVYPDITEYMTIFPDFINGMAGRSFEQ